MALRPNDDNDKNEISLTASYYHLFRIQHPQQNTTVVATDRTDNTTAAAAAAAPSGGFWEEDEWTAQDEEQAERLLQASREKCSLRHHATTNKEDEQAWNKFYSQHQTRFFNDRHYLHKAFPEEFCVPETETNNDGGSTNHRTLVEIGCGVGNLLLPLLEDNNNIDNTDDKEVSNKKSENIDKNSALASANNNMPIHEFQWTVFGLDLAREAIKWLQRDGRFQRAAAQGRATALVHDISLPQLPDCLLGTAHVTTLLFCLSAIAPGPRMVQAVRNAAATLKEPTDDSGNGGGVLVFRDYGRYDEAQLKLGTSRNKLLEDNFYKKHDGTKCYYFSLEDVRELFEQEAGLTILELKYLKRIYRNRGTNEVRRRVWVQGRFQKTKL